MAGTISRKLTAEEEKHRRFLLKYAELDIFNSSFKEINRLLLKYAAGNFKYRGKISGMLNSVDTVISGINMLGEELQTSTISRDYFTGIFNAVPDMIFVLSPKGKIKSINRSATDFFNLKSAEDPEILLSEIIELDEEKIFFRYLKNALTKNASFACEANLTNRKNSKIPVWCLGNKITNNRNKLSGYLLVARDITDKKQSENRVLRAIVETQENEQRRVAEDLHDSLGQELSALKLYLNTLQNQIEEDNRKAKDMLQQSVRLLDKSIQNLRGICFNLLPGTIQLSGLSEAIDKLVHDLNAQNIIDIDYLSPQKYIPVKKAMEVAIYRIIQEFINNSIKHSNALRISIRLIYTDKIKLYLSDNGIGFNIKKLKYSGNGIKNMRSRVNAFNGNFNLTSSPEEGTNVFIEIPYPDEHDN